MEAAVEDARASNRQVQAADLPADALLHRALAQMVLDFEHVKKAGPFKLRSAKTLLSRDRERAKILSRITGIIESDDPAAAIASLDPPHPQYAAMLDAHRAYRTYAKNTCPTLVTTWKIRPGMTGDEVKRLQQRLACEGYYAGPIDGVFEGPALAAAKAYQSHHEMKPDGMVFKGTLASMNVPLSKRIEQIRLALQRMRESDIGQMDDFFIRVNLPLFEVQIYDKGEVIRRERVIVGTNRLDDDKSRLVQGHLNRTKLFTTELYQVIVNPSWILPARVVKGELRGQIAKDPQYLEKNNIREKTLPDGTKVYVQGRAGNVLGKVKFLLRESNAIYLHDTNKRGLFRERRRDFSHGCVRVQNAVDLAEWILKREETNERDMRRVFKADSFERGFTLKKPIDLITEYITVDISDAGRPIFLTDIYKYDRAYFDGNLPPMEQTRWGGIRLRPRWVPQVSEETVNAWRAKGMAAPRNYDPERHGK
ncbi:MAG: murein L,D-transpeptidase YcbB/YkuD [Myxococcota bacterium]